MVLELVDIRIHADQQAAFEHAVRHGLDTILSRAKGFQRYEVRHCIESPERYVLLIHWETLEAHTVDFRESPAYVEWRGVVGPFFAQPPIVEHFEEVAASTP